VAYPHHSSPERGGIDPIWWAGVASGQLVHGDVRIILMAGLSRLGCSRLLCLLGLAVAIDDPDAGLGQRLGALCVNLR
jgi:hypothetical protein